jgi:Lysozyme like domain
MILTEQEARFYLSMAGFSGTALDYAVQIMSCESGFNTLAHADTQIEDSRGLMQINVKAHPQWTYIDLYDPQINCNIAYQLFVSRGYNFQDWTCAQNLGLVYPGPELPGKKKVT